MEVFFCAHYKTWSMKSSCTYLFCLSLVLLTGQRGIAQNDLILNLNLLGDPSCENLADQESNGRHPVDPVYWTASPIQNAIKCFNAGALGSSSTAVDGSHFFSHDFSNATGSIMQIIDLEQDRSGEAFFYSFAYRLVDGTSMAADHEITVTIEALAATGTSGTVVFNQDYFFQDGVDFSYQFIDGTTSAVPAGTTRIKWEVVWHANPPSFSNLIMDDFKLRYADGQCVGIPDFPYFCFTDPKMISGDVIQMTCDQFFDDNYINGLNLITVSETDICDDDGTIIIKRPKSGTNNQLLKETPGSTKSLAGCMRELVFKGDNFDPGSPCADSLVLIVEITDTPEPPAFDVPADVIVPCGYDVNADPEGLIGFPTNISGQISYTDFGNGDCDSELFRVWQAENCCGAIFEQEQIITVLDGVCDPLISPLIVAGDPIPGSIYHSRQIVSDGVVNNASGRVSFYAAENIVLQPGFVVEAGSEFQAVIEACTEVPNDLCDDALPLICGETIYQSTVSATDQGVGSIDNCSALGVFADPVLNEGIFFSFYGSGGPVRISTVNAFTNFDTELRLYEGNTCHSLTCVAGNDDASGGTQSEILYTTVANQLYYVYVDGYQGQTGNFAIKMDCLVECGLSIVGDNFEASNTYTQDDYSVCPANWAYGGRDVEHELEVTTGDTYQISLSGLNDDLDLIVLRRDGNDNFVECIGISENAGQFDDELVSSFLGPGIYSIIVDDYSEEAFNLTSYLLTISCSAQQLNTQANSSPPAIQQPADIPSELTKKALAIRAAPNPFEQKTRLSYTLQEATELQLEVYDTKGVRLSIPVSQQFQDAGTYQLELDLTAYPPGIYYIQLQHEGGQVFEKIVKQ